MGKVLFYGAGEHAAMIYRHAVRKSASYGEPMAFIDKDVYKQGHDLFGLPVISWEDAQEQYGDDFYIYVTGNEQVAPDILGFLQEQGIPKERIINWEPVEKRLSCGYAESFLNIEPNGDSVHFFACNRNALSLSYVYPECRYIVHHSEASRPEKVCAAVEFVQKAAQKITEGDQEGYHTGCRNMKKQYCYSERKLRTVAFVGVAPCNFKCIYCILNHKDFYPITYKPYPVSIEILKQLEDNGYMNEDTFIKISSGEISVAEGGNRLAELTGHYPLTIFTNAGVFSPQVAAALDYSGMIVCDIDAGTRESFRKIKGVDAFDRVRNNLREYAKHGAITLKYILLTDLNDSEEDLQGFFDIADEVATRIDLTRDYANVTERFSDKTLQFAARFIKHFRNHGKLNMNMAAFIRPSEKERLNKMLEEL